MIKRLVSYDENNHPCKDCIYVGISDFMGGRLCLWGGMTYSKCGRYQEREKLNKKA
jgi:hypothetical protein